MRVGCNLANRLKSAARRPLRSEKLPGEELAKRVLLNVYEYIIRTLVVVVEVRCLHQLRPICRAWKEICNHHLGFVFGCLDIGTPDYSQAVPVSYILHSGRHVGWNSCPAVILLFPKPDF